VDYEAEYDNRARVPDFPDIVADWIARSARLRGDVPAADLGIPYGPSSRQILDVMWPDTTRKAPVVLFFHGGYWQRQHPREVTFVAQGCLAHGVAVALAGYDLAPDVPLSAGARGGGVPASPHQAADGGQRPFRRGSSGGGAHRHPLARSGRSRRR